MRKYAFAMLLMAGVCLAAMSAVAKEDGCGGSNLPCCNHCGCRCDCLQKVCTVVRDTKKAPKTCWCVERQEIGLLMPGHRDCCDPCDKPPRCGRTKCVQKLVKKEYTVEVPCYKCVVQYLCPTCCGGHSNGSTPVAPNPPAPKPAPAATPKIPMPPTMAK